MKRLMIWKDRAGFINRLYINQTTFEKLMNVVRWISVVEIGNHKTYELGVNPWYISCTIKVIEF